MASIINATVRMPEAWDHPLKGFEPISLSEMNNVKLLNRVDSKFIIPIKELPGIMRRLRDRYYILEIDGRQLSNYCTTYYDTPDLQFYQDHHNGLANRVKIRCREYIESRLRFFEIKIKSNGQRTSKFRVKLTHDEPFEINETHYKQIRKHYKYPVESLSPTIINTYKRITLVNKAKTERCTIDLDIAFRDPGAPHKKVETGGFVIIELKQSSVNMMSPVASLLRDKGIHPGSISKYILGIMLTRPQIKSNAFKPLMLTLNKISQGKISA